MKRERITRREVPFPLYEVDLAGAGDEELLEIKEALGLGLSLEEMRALRDHFEGLGRRATDVELQTVDQTWSEHCFHKTFKGLIETPEGVVDGLLKTYIRRVAEELRPDWCFSIFEDNAGIVDFDGVHGIAIKVETHNHPSAIDPFGGAATGTGGVIRDILGVWADPIACTDVLCFGPLDTRFEDLPPGMKHPRFLYSGVVAGIGSYGNNMGIPTVNGAIYFDEGYIGNIVVYCGCIGILPKDRYFRDVKAGDAIVLAGGRTGRDGIHGVTFASAELTEESEEVSRPAVQIPNPIEEEKLKRAIIQIRDEGLGSGITDLGGGGLSSAVGETAHRYGLGAEVELGVVPLKDPTLAPWEIWISESQERMLLAIPPKNLDRAMEVFEEEDVEATVIGQYTKRRRLRIFYAAHIVADLDLGLLFTPPRVRRRAEWRPPRLQEPRFEMPPDLTETLLSLLSSPNIASKESVVRTYDHEVQGRTVIKPLQGEYSGPNDAAVLKPLPDSWRGIVVSCGMNPRYGKIDPYWMAASAIDEAVRNNVAVGGRRVALLDNFTWGNPERPDRLGGLVRAARACYEIASALGTPFVSGKDSLYNESPLGPVTPTLLITALGIIPDIRRAVTVDLKRPGDLLYLLGETHPELGGSEYYRLMGFLGLSVPKVDAVKARETFTRLTEAIDRDLVEACHDLSEGGLAVAASEMAFSGGLGLEVDLGAVRVSSPMRDDLLLFSESNSRFLVEVSPDNASEFERVMEGVIFSRVGRVLEERRVRFYGSAGRLVVDASLSDLLEAWRSTLR
ncbi:phosphoribosylformylglycinamidine synthase subunit PurL [Candidatus Bathyarchaeota archaeon]|nr:MAG: phosphoribosylformylglycinamidine synthase subunit PurL [Candidatus Bathyarchaeota archaeon]